MPFATRQDNDDIACWDVGIGRVVVVHDFASAGYEHVAEFDTFYAWFQQAVEDFVNFE